LLKPRPCFDLHSASQATNVERRTLSHMFESGIRDLKAYFSLPPDESEEEISDLAAFVISLIIAALVVIITVGTHIIVEQIQKHTEQERVVAWTIRSLPDLQSAIESLAIEISQRDAKLSDFRKTCEHLDIDPERDLDYRRWSRDVVNLTKERESLIRTRSYAYLESYKAGLDSDLEYESPPRKMALHALREAHRVSQVIQDYRVPSSPRLEPAPPGLGPQTSSTESRPTSSSP
jgi:hypothetical protein